MSQTIFIVKNLEPDKISNATALSLVSQVVLAGQVSLRGNVEYSWMTSFPDGLNVSCVKTDEKYTFSVFTDGED